MPDALAGHDSSFPEGDIEKSEAVILPNGREVSPVNEKRRASSYAEKTLEQHNDADEAMKAFLGGDVPELTPESNARLLRIIDWHLMPLMCLVYGLNYLDKVLLPFSICKQPFNLAIDYPLLR